MKKKNNFEFFEPKEEGPPKYHRFQDEDIQLPTPQDLVSDPLFEIPRPKVKFELINDWDKFLSLVNDLMKSNCIASDTETNGLSRRHRLCGYSFSYQINHGSSEEPLLRNVYIPVRHRTGEANLNAKLVAEHLIAVFKRNDVLWLFWNARFEFHQFQKEGLPLPLKFIDAYLIKRSLDPTEPASLKYSAIKILGEDAIEFKNAIDSYIRIFCSKNKIVNIKKDRLAPSYYDYVYLSIMTPYAASDSYYTWIVAHVLLKELKEYAGCLQLSSLEHLALPIVFELEHNGIYVNRITLKQNIKIATDQLVQVEKELVDFLGDPPVKLSNLRLLGIRLREKGIPVLKPTKSTRSLPLEHQVPSLTESALLRMLHHGHKIAGVILQYNKLNYQLKTLTGIKRSMDYDGHVRADFNQIGTSSGRITTREPNIQGYPQKSDDFPLFTEILELDPELSEDFILLFCDLNQIDLRMIAYLSREPSLLDGFRNMDDIHAMTAHNIFREQWDTADNIEKRRMRAVGKKLNFSIYYGIGAEALADALIKDGLFYSVKECSIFIRSFKRDKPMVMKWINEVKISGASNGYVCNMFGRIKNCEELMSPHLLDSERSKIELSIVNHMAQSTAADFYKKCLVASKNSLVQKGVRHYFINTVHDEVHIVVEKNKAMEGASIIKNSFEAVGAELFDIPILVNIEYTEGRIIDRRPFNLYKAAR